MSNVTKAFAIATRDPNNEEVGEIAGVDFYRRELSASEEAEFWDKVLISTDEVKRSGKTYQTAHEMIIFEPYLRLRAVDQEKVPEGWYAASVPSDAHITVMEIFAPNMARAVKRAQRVLEGGSEEGKQSSGRQAS